MYERSRFAVESGRMGAKSSRIYLRGSHLAFLVALSFLFAAAVFLLIGLVQMPGSSKLVILFPTVLFFLAAYYIDKASVGWIRISNDGTDLVRTPSWFARKLLNEARIVARIEPGTEFVICRRIGYGFVNGYSMILRAPDGREQVIWETSDTEAQQWVRRVGNQVAASHELKVCFVSRSISDQGVEEDEWTAESWRFRWRKAAILMVTMLSPLAGIGVRCVTADLAVILIAGAAVWVVECGCFLWWVRKGKTVKGASVAGAILLWTMQFVTFYGLAVVFAAQVIVPEWFRHKL